MDAHRQVLRHPAPDSPREPMRDGGFHSLLFLAAAGWALAPYLFLMLLTQGCTHIDWATPAPSVHFVQTYGLNTTVVEGQAQVALDFDYAWGLVAQVYANGPDGAAIVVELDDLGDGIVTIGIPVVEREPASDPCYCGYTGLWVHLLTPDGELVGFDGTSISYAIDWVELQGELATVLPPPECPGDSGGDSASGALE